MRQQTRRRRTETARPAATSGRALGRCGFAEVPDTHNAAWVEPRGYTFANEFIMDLARPAEPPSNLHGNVPRCRLVNFGTRQREQDFAWPLTSDHVSLSTGCFRELLCCAVERIRFDERFYPHLYPDVVDALAPGLFTDAHHHYVECGYFEDRLPFCVEVDDAYYFRIYADIAAEVSAGTMPSAQVHFELYGFKEGRLPREGWSLLAS